MISGIIAGLTFVLAVIGLAGGTVWALLSRRTPVDYDASSRQQAIDVSASTDRLLAVATPEQLREGIAALESFVRAMEAFYNGRPFSPGDAELHATLLACITKLTEHVCRPVVTP